MKESDSFNIGGMNMIKFKGHSLITSDFDTDDVRNLLEDLGFSESETFLKGQKFQADEDCHFVVKKGKTVKEMSGGIEDEFQMWMVLPMQENLKTKLISKLINNYFEELFMLYTDAEIEVFDEKAEEFKRGFKRLMKECYLYGDAISHSFS